MTRRTNSLEVTSQDQVAKIASTLHQATQVSELLFKWTDNDVAVAHLLVAAKLMKDLGIPLEQLKEMVEVAYLGTVVFGKPGIPV